MSQIVVRVKRGLNSTYLNSCYIEFLPTCYLDSWGSFLRPRKCIRTCLLQGFDVQGIGHVELERPKESAAVIFQSNASRYDQLHYSVNLGAKSGFYSHCCCWNKLERRLGFGSENKLFGVTWASVSREMFFSTPSFPLSKKSYNSYQIYQLYSSYQPCQVPIVLGTNQKATFAFQSRCMLRNQAGKFFYS